MKNEGVLAMGSNGSSGIIQRVGERQRTLEDQDPRVVNMSSATASIQGLIQKQCKNYKVNKRKKKLENTSTARVATENAVELISISLGKMILNFLILDLDCSFHMCAKNTYEKNNGGKVLMKNNIACNVVGVGTVNIKIHDDTLRTFGNV